MAEIKIYAYGMICISNSFVLKEFPTIDKYSEIEQSYRFPGGETGTCGVVLASLGANVTLDGTHIGREAIELVRDFFKDKSIDISLLKFDGSFDSLEDYVLITEDKRTPFGRFGHFFKQAYEENICHWNKPSEKAIEACTVSAIDDCFGEDSKLAAKLCRKYSKPYVTIDCPYDGYLHRHSAVTVISDEYLNDNYRDIPRDEMISRYAENGGGLTIITNGPKDLIYSRKNGEIHTFQPFSVKTASTLGAGDSFKAGCTYALAAGLNDYELVRFASACAAAAISRYPMQFDPPTLEEIQDLIDRRSEQSKI